MVPVLRLMHEDREIHREDYVKVVTEFMLRNTKSLDDVVWHIKYLSRADVQVVCYSRVLCRCFPRQGTESSKGQGGRGSG